jgi:hypothetical protein
MAGMTNQLICSNCKSAWPAGQTECFCGRTTKTANQSVEIHVKSSVQVFWTLNQIVWEKNWKLIVVFVVLQFVLAVVSYWTSGWISVGWSIFGSLASTIMALFIVAKVVTKTSDR